MKALRKSPLKRSGKPLRKTELPPYRRVTSETVVKSTREVPGFVVETLACGHIYLRDLGPSAKRRRCLPCIHWTDL